MPSDMVGDFVVIQGNTDVPVNTTKRFTLADPTRIAIIIANNVTAQVYIGIHDTPDPGDVGDLLYMGGQTAPFALYFRDVGALVCQEFWAGAVGNNVDLSWWEVCYRPAAANPQ